MEIMAFDMATKELLSRSRLDEKEYKTTCSTHHKAHNLLYASASSARSRVLLPKPRYPLSPNKNPSFNLFVQESRCSSPLSPLSLRCPPRTPQPLSFWVGCSHVDSRLVASWSRVRVVTRPCPSGVPTVPASYWPPCRQLRCRFSQKPCSLTASQRPGVN